MYIIYTHNMSFHHEMPTWSLAIVDSPRSGHHGRAREHHVLSGDLDDLDRHKSFPVQSLFLTRYTSNHRLDMTIMIA